MREIKPTSKPYKRKAMPKRRLAVADKQRYLMEALRPMSASEIAQMAGPIPGGFPPFYS